MKIIPILFSTDMVQAIEAGRKTQTRRIVKPHKHAHGGFEVRNETVIGFDANHSFILGNNAVINWDANGNELVSTCPYGQPGDVLWVRECYTIHMDSFQGSYSYTHGQDVRYPPHYLDKNGIKRCIDYKADYPNAATKWKPSIHMPFCACRYFLRVKNVRVERLQNISDSDCISEGIERSIFPPTGEECYYFYPCKDLRDDSYLDFPKTSYYSLWKSIYGQESWDANPLVWVIEFERIVDKAEIDEIRRIWNERKNI